MNHRLAQVRLLFVFQPVNADGDPGDPIPVQREVSAIDYKKDWMTPHAEGFIRNVIKQLAGVAHDAAHPE
jgi:hypothetical protein